MNEGLEEAVAVGPIVVGIFVEAADEGKDSVGSFVGSSVVRLEDDIDVNVVANALSETLLLGEDVSG